MIYLTKTPKIKTPPSIWECLGACLLGAILGGGLMYAYIIRTGGF